MFDPDELVETARQLVRMGGERGVTLRILGHLAVRDHTRWQRELLGLLERVPTHDIDFAGYSREQNQANRLFVEELGYKPDPAVALSQEYGIKRLIYHRDDGLLAEVFLDELRMAHVLDFRSRLQLDSPTISLVDLLLSKLQIVQITEKDIKDIIVLLAEHDLGGGDRDMVDVSYLLGLTRNDWGLHRTVHTNLGKVREFASHYDVINSLIRQNIEARIDAIVDGMESEPKSMKWKIRAKVGTRVKWYEDVGDVHR